MKSTVAQYTSRGKVDVFVTIDNSEAEDINVKLNESLLRGYLGVFEKLIIHN